MKGEELFKDGYNLYIKQEMMLSGLHLRDVANKMEMSVEGVRQALNGRGSCRTIRRICNAIGLDMKKLLKPVMGEE